MANRDEFGVCVIRAGADGGVMIKELTAAGFRVVALERGPTSSSCSRPKGRSPSRRSANGSAMVRALVCRAGLRCRVHSGIAHPTPGMALRSLVDVG